MNALSEAIWCLPIVASVVMVHLFVRYLAAQPTKGKTILKLRQPQRRVHKELPTHPN
jgi:hypothetical protein